MFRFNLSSTGKAAGALCILLSLSAPAVEVTVQVDAPGKSISTDLIGIFLEDLSYAADGGLYAELVQNRSFEYSAADRDGWHSLTAWDLVERDGGRGRVLVDTGQPVHPNNPHYAVLGIAAGPDAAAGAVGLRNAGYDGIVIQAGEQYRFSVFARQLAFSEGPLTVRIETADGQTLGEATLGPLTGRWEQYTAILTATGSSTDARLVVQASHPGRIGLDMISLFPTRTFMNRENGLRPDLAQVIADLRPRIVRFPGGCLVHGDGLDNMYRWKDTIGPLEQRRAQRNIWHYHQSLGLGFFEYFQFCMDIGAEPVPIVPAGVSCQNSGASVAGIYGHGQRAIPMEDMAEFIQDILDLIEYANGPADSPWGARRAAAGHPEPFHLKYLGVGNEDKVTPAYTERFQMIYAALQQAHPEITVIGTVGPNPDRNDPDFRAGWNQARAMDLEMVCEHAYKHPRWFWENLDRYDGYDRDQAHVYLGEWAGHDQGRRPTLRAALAEAAFLTGVERNGDVVRMTSYAPLLAKHGHTHWNPNLIYFSNTAVYPTVSYQVQKLFSENAGDFWLPTSIQEQDGADAFAMSSVRDTASGDIILKMVHNGSQEREARITLEGFSPSSAQAVRTTLWGDPDTVNDHQNASPVLPEKSPVEVSASFTTTLPASSLTILRIPGHP